jgi:hypothetical protein
MADTRSRISGIATADRAIAGSLHPGFDEPNLGQTRVVRTLRGSSPRSTFETRMKLDKNRPAPIVSTTASAISETTSADRSRVPPAVALRLPSRSRPGLPGRESCRAGANPNSSPVTTDESAVTPSTLTSSATVEIRGSDSGSEFRSTSIPQLAISSPTSVPAVASSRLSTSRPRAIRHRLAPSAARVWISRPRALARASIRLATFTHAISRTAATAPSSRSIHARTLPTVASCSDRTAPT